MSQLAGPVPQGEPVANLVPDTAPAPVVPELAPLPGQLPTAEAPAPDAAAPDAVVPEPVTPEPAPSEPASAEDAAEVPAVPPALPVTDAPADVPAVSASDAGVQMPDGAQPATPHATPPAAPLPVGPEGEAPPRPAELPPPPPVTADEELLLTPPEPEVADAAPFTPDPAPADDAPATDMPATEPPVADLPSNPDPAPPPARPVPGLGNLAEGVVTGRLPRIGDAPPGAVDGAADSAVGDPAAAEPAPATDTPLRRHARAFANPAGKPLFAILLVDDGAVQIDRAELAALDLPLSIVIDPLSDGAAERAAAWRAGGQEVVMAGSGIPQGAGPGDLEQSMQVLQTRLPEAVAVVDTDGRHFQNDRPLAGQIVPILAEQGRGLLTLDQGLNAADQTARREGLPAATIFRRLDAEDEGAPVIQRYLDRAAFKAAQEGQVAVIGRLRPETIEAILQWAVEGRAATVAVAPVSALLLR